MKQSTGLQTILINKRGAATVWNCLFCLLMAAVSLLLLLYMELTGSIQNLSEVVSGAVEGYLTDAAAENLSDLRQGIPIEEETLIPGVLAVLQGCADHLASSEHASALKVQMDRMSAEVLPGQGTRVRISYRLVFPVSFLGKDYPALTVPVVQTVGIRPRI